MVAALPDGNFVVTWYSQDGGDGSGTLIRARLFNADGMPVGNDFVVNSTTAGDQTDVAVAALPDGHFVVTWGIAARSPRTTVQCRRHVGGQ